MCVLLTPPIRRRIGLSFFLPLAPTTRRSFTLSLTHSSHIRYFLILILLINVSSSCRVQLVTSLLPSPHTHTDSPALLRRLTSERRRQVDRLFYFLYINLSNKLKQGRVTSALPPRTVRCTGTDYDVRQLVRTLGRESGSIKHLCGVCGVVSWSIQPPLGPNARERKRWAAECRVVCGAC
jgi:hypothetical protein